MINWSPDVILIPIRKNEIWGILIEHFRVSRWLKCDNNFIIEQNNCIYMWCTLSTSPKQIVCLSPCISFYVFILHSQLFYCNTIFFYFPHFFHISMHFAYIALKQLFHTCNAMQCIKIISCWIAPVYCCSIYSPYYDFYWIWSANQAGVVNKGWTRWIR